MIKDTEIQRVINCNIGKKCNNCKIGKYKGIKLIGLTFIICDNCGKNLLKK